MFRRHKEGKAEIFRKIVTGSAGNHPQPYPVVICDSIEDLVNGSITTDHYKINGLSITGDRQFFCDFRGMMLICKIGSMLLLNLNHIIQYIVKSRG